MWGRKPLAVGGDTQERESPFADVAIDDPTA
jgi:hypothetical protein